MHQRSQLTYLIWTVWVYMLDVLACGSQACSQSDSISIWCIIAAHDTCVCFFQKYAPAGKPTDWCCICWCWSLPGVSFLSGLLYLRPDFKDDAGQVKYQVSYVWIIHSCAVLWQLQVYNWSCTLGIKWPVIDWQKQSPFEGKNGMCHIQARKLCWWKLKLVLWAGSSWFKQLSCWLDYFHSTTFFVWKCLSQHSFVLWVRHMLWKLYCTVPWLSSNTSMVVENWLNLTAVWLNVSGSFVRRITTLLCVYMSCLCVHCPLSQRVVVLWHVHSWLVVMFATLRSLWKDLQRLFQATWF